MFLFYQLLMLVVVSVVVAVPLQTGIVCPNKCSCSDANVTCTDNQLSIVPELKKLNFYPESVDLSGNDIEDVTNKHFVGKFLEKLSRLNINDNSLIEIEAYSFSSLPSLKYLDLSNNLLGDIPRDIIAHNKDLTELNLAGNVFGSNTPTLTSTSLEVLDLSFCKLSHFEEEHLKGLPNLRVLNLQANNLQRFDYRMLTSTNLIYVDLYFNSWECRCETIKLFDYLLEKDLIEIEGPIQCMHKNKWYEDVYDENGPMHHNKLCKQIKKHHSRDLEKPVEKQEPKEVVKEDVQKNDVVEEDDTQSFLSFEMWIAISVVLTLIIGCVLTIALVWRKLYRQVQQNQRPEENYYSELLK